MDCVCIWKQSCLGAVVNSDNSFYVLSPSKLTEIDTKTLHVKTVIPTTHSYSPDRLYSIQIHDEHLYIFSNSAEYQVYSLSPAEYVKSVLCSGKKPYIPHCTLVAKDLVIFSTLSHSNVYLFSLSALNSLGQVKKPVKLKLPSKVMVNSLALHPDENFLIGACNDGAIRLWNLDNKEEQCPLVNTGDEKRTKKTVRKLLKKGLSSVRSADFSPDGSQIISGDDSGLVTLWDTSDIANIKFLTSSRVSGFGLIDIAYYSDNSKFIALIKEGRVLLLEVSKSKIKYSSIFIIQNPTSPKPCKCLFALKSGHILMNWRDDENMLYLLSGITENPTTVVAALPGQGLLELFPSPVVYQSRFYYVSNRKLFAYDILDSKIKEMLQVEKGCISGFIVRPMDNPLHVLVVTDNIIVLYDIRKNLQSNLEGCTAVIVGRELEPAQTIILLCEDRISLGIYDIPSGTCKILPLAAKVKNLYWSPNTFGVTYETMHEHSIRLSCGFASKKIEDIGLDLSYRLEYDENLVLALWNPNGSMVALATTKRICTLTSSLSLIKNYSILDRVISLYWYGNTLIYSTCDGVYYCGDTAKLVLHTFAVSLLCGVLNDRIYVLSSGTIKAIPCNMIEPLLWGCLESDIDTSQINKIVRLMATPCISEEIIKKTLNKGHPQAAWHLAEKSLISNALKIEILKQLHKFEEIEKIILHGKDISDPIEYRNFLEELHSDHNWKPEKMLIPQIADFFDSCGQLEKEAKFLKISKNYWGLSLLHLSVGNKYALTEELQENEPNLDDVYVEPIELIPKLNLGYGELAYRQLVGNQDILVAYSDNLAQWFGLDALKAPEKFVPQFMEHEVSVRNEEEEEKREISEIDAICTYLRCDEGKGEAIVDVISGKTYRVNEAQWGGPLEESDPLDFDDKWGKQALPSHKVLINDENFLVIDELKLGKIWSFEMWVNVHGKNFTFLQIGNFSVQVLSKKIVCSVNGDEIQLELHEGFCKPTTSVWEHLCITVKEQNFSLYLGGNLSCSGKIGTEIDTESIRIAGFNGFVTELRVWKTCRTLEQIKENFRCPLEVLSEKRKKKWGNIKINKSENKIEVQSTNKIEFRLSMPENKQKLELKPLQISSMPKKLGPPGPLKSFLPLSKPKSTLSELFTFFSQKDFTSASKWIETFNSPLESETKLVRLYKFTLEILKNIGKLIESTRERKQLKGAAYYNLLSKVKINPEHKKIIMFEAVKQNVKVRNFGIASKEIYSMLDQANDEETSFLEGELKTCIENESQDKAERYEEILAEVQEDFSSKFVQFTEEI